MPADAIAHPRTLQFNTDVVEYLERIHDTLDPFDGRFLVHGGELEVKEGQWPGTIVVIQFPGMDEARSWYDSPAYRDILHFAHRPHRGRGDHRRRRGRRATTRTSWPPPSRRS